METPITLDDAEDDSVIDLNEAHFLRRGGRRDCYLHPCDATLCIKVERDRGPSPRAWHQRLERWRLTRLSGDELNRREWRAYRRFGAVLAPYVPRYHGLVRTSLGPGLAVALVRDRDGTPSPRLNDWLSSCSPRAADALLVRFGGLFDLLKREDIWVMDLHFRNFLVQDADDGTARPRLIDLKRVGRTEILQPAGWSVRSKRRKLARRIDRFHAQFASALSR